MVQMWGLGQLAGRWRAEKELEGGIVVRKAEAKVGRRRDRGQDLYIGLDRGAHTSTTNPEVYSDRCIVTILRDGLVRAMKTREGECQAAVSYGNSKTSMGTYQLKSRYREHSQSRSRSRSRWRSRRKHSPRGRRSDSKKILQGGIGLALAGAAVIGTAQYGSNHRDQHTKRRREESNGCQASDRWRGRDR